MKPYTTTADGDLVLNVEGECYLRTDVDAELAAKDARIAELEVALRNCMLLAMQKIGGGQSSDESSWRAVVRYADEGGCGPSPLRAALSAPPA